MGAGTRRNSHLGSEPQHPAPRPVVQSRRRRGRAGRGRSVRRRQASKQDHPGSSAHHQQHAQPPSTQPTEARTRRRAPGAAARGCTGCWSSAACQSREGRRAEARHNTNAQAHHPAGGGAPRRRPRTQPSLSPSQKVGGSVVAAQLRPGEGPALVKTPTSVDAGGEAQQARVGLLCPGDGLWGLLCSLLREKPGQAQGRMSWRRMRSPPDMDNVFLRCHHRGLVRRLGLRRGHGPPLRVIEQRIGFRSRGSRRRVIASVLTV
mmetsp:Transcript_59839/g.160194  ORF Transcript_59839/g.160194 Transcript_59839/m.160194 type:complete len:262 (+) Transcript_59839:85-870(+)